MSITELVTRLNTSGIKLLTNVARGWVFTEFPERVPMYLQDQVTRHRLPLMHLLAAEGIWDPLDDMLRQAKAMQNAIRKEGDEKCP
jgi:hypothetical protein